VPDTQFPGTFAHIAGGYAAAYYGYMWAEVLALDMLSAYGGNIMDGTVGRRFRAEILSRGGEEPARALVERFLGRPVNNEAFIKEITGRR
jgi:thimet oligopeptidase